MTLVFDLEGKVFMSTTLRPRSRRLEGHCPPCAIHTSDRTPRVTRCFHPTGMLPSATEGQLRMYVAGRAKNKRRERQHTGRWNEPQADDNSESAGDMRRYEHRKQWSHRRGNDEQAP